MAMFALTSVPQRVAHAASATMTVNAPNTTQPVGGASFVVKIDVSGASAYKSYQYHLAYASNTPFSGSILTQYVGDSDAGLLTGCTPAATTFPLASYSMFAGCAKLSGADVAANGTVANVVLKCVAPGTATLHLVTDAAEGYAQLTKMNDASGPVTVTAVDDTVTCGLPITKTDDTVGGQIQVGGVVTYTVHVGNPTASASGPHTVTDTLPAGLTNMDNLTSTGGLGPDGCSLDAVPPAAVSFTCTTVSVPIDPGGWDLTFTADTVTVGPDVCNEAVLDSDAIAKDCINILSKNVRMVKDTNGNTAETQENTNLWLCTAAACSSPVAGLNAETPAQCGNGVNDDASDDAVIDDGCPINGQGFLDIDEWVLNVGADPDGVGAFEFQLKFDHKIFDITIDPTDWLYSTGRVPGATGIGGCAATIVTENAIRFGCASKNYSSPPGPLSPPAVIGVQDDGIAAKIHVTPEADLVNRLTPGNNNGVIRTLLNENCELADIWGHPLSDGTLDALDREIPLPGIVTGGLVQECADITITVRILEGDLNLDCKVDVTDDQAIASRYGAFFGNLMYQPWYDLEPALKDFDVDIKDLQKVFGRNWSTCASPIPAQDPQTEPIPQ